MEHDGELWTFGDHMHVRMNLPADSDVLGLRLGRSPGAIDAAKASIEATSNGTSHPNFPGPKWEQFEARYRAGER